MRPVFHIITTLERGGAENQLQILVEAQKKSGRCVTVIPLKGKPELVESFRSFGVNVLTSWMNMGTVQQILGIRKSLRNHQVVVHAHLPRSEMLAAFAVKRENLIVSRHNAEAFFPGAPQWVSILLSRFVTHGGTKVIAITGAVKEFLIASGEVRANKEINVVEYGFPANEFVNNFDEQQTLKARLGIKNSEIVIGTIGRLVHQKDYPTLIKGFAEFLSLGFEGKLLVLGEGPLRKDLEKLSTGLGVGDRIIWVGKKDNVFSYLKLMDVFVLASKYEGFGLVLLEAMSVGLPIVAARNLAVEQVLGANYPWLFEIASEKELAIQIDSILNENNRSASIYHGSQRLAYFSVSRMLGKMDNLYKH